MESVLNTKTSEYEVDFNLEKTVHEIMINVKESPQVLALVEKIDMNNLETVMNFGQDATEEISKFADRILNSVETTKVEDSGQLLNQLNKIMDKFDIKDFEEKPQGIFQKVFNRAKNSVDHLFEKYHTMGNEIDKLYIHLKEYETSIKDANLMLEEMFQNNIAYYEALEKHIHAGKLMTSNLKEEIIPKLEQQAGESKDFMVQVSLSNAHQVLDMLEQRIHDLQLARTIALQTMPQVKMIQNGNYNLVRKINSAFIITIPIFKQSLTQAITLKRQAIQAKAIAALDEKTNELLIRNAENTALQSKITAQLASGSSIKIETLEKTWNTIMQGIVETKEIHNQEKEKRKYEAKRLEEIKKEYQNRTK